MDRKIKNCKKSFASLIVISIILSSFSPVFAKKAEAQWITWDPGNFVPNLMGSVKDYGLDTIAWLIASKVIERMSKSTVNWINGGFKGSPAYITNPGAYFKDLGDNLAGQYIFNNPDLNFLCSPIKTKIKIALTTAYNGSSGSDSTRFQCKLTQVGKNLDNFVADFANGGWDSFFTVSQTPSENPLGAYLEAESQLFGKIAAKSELKQQELSQGKGFLSYKSCARWNAPVNTDVSAYKTFEASQSVGGRVGDLDENGNIIINPPATDAPIPDSPEAPKSLGDAYNAGTAVPTCAEEKVNTPGSVISEQLNKTLGLGGEKLVTADEINEIVSALLNQLVGQIVGGIGKGLRSLSQPSTAGSNGGQTFTNSLGNSLRQSPVVGYFCLDEENDPTSPYYDTDPNTCAHPDVPDTKILDVPPFDPNVSPTGGTLVSPEDVIPLVPITNPGPASNPPPPEPPAP